MRRCGRALAVERDDLHAARSRSAISSTGLRIPSRLRGRSLSSAATRSSNESFSGGTKTFTDPRLCAAIVDRLTFAGNVIETGTVFYRLVHARA
jgi:hypothetical protein